MLPECLGILGIEVGGYVTLSVGGGIDAVISASHVLDGSILFGLVGNRRLDTVLPVVSITDSGVAIEREDVTDEVGHEASGVAHIPPFGVLVVVLIIEGTKDGRTGLGKGVIGVEHHVRRLTLRLDSVPNGAFTHVRGVVVVHIRELRVVADLEPIGNLDRTLGADVEHRIVVRVIFEDTALIVVTAGNQEISLVATALDSDIVLLAKSPVLIEHVKPVGASVVGIFPVRLGHDTGHTVSQVIQPGVSNLQGRVEL